MTGRMEQDLASPTAIKAARGVGLIAADAPFGRHIANRLQARLEHTAHPLTAILVVDRNQRPATDSAKNPRRRFPGLGRIRRIFSPEKHMAHTVWAFEREANAEFTRQAGAPPDWPPGVARLTASPSLVNADDTVAWLSAFDLRLLVLGGAPILKAPILETAEQTLNMHSSLLPSYRGTRAEFWQVHNGDLDRAGLTVHFVDTGIDTGDIVFQKALQPKSTDGPWLMRSRNQLNGLVALPDAVVSVISGTAECRPQMKVQERAYRYSDITPEAMQRVLRKIGRAPKKTKVSD